MTMPLESNSPFVCLRTKWAQKAHLQLIFWKSIARIESHSDCVQHKWKKMKENFSIHQTKDVHHQEVSELDWCQWKLFMFCTNWKYFPTKEQERLKVSPCCIIEIDRKCIDVINWLLISSSLVQFSSKSEIPMKFNKSKMLIGKF